MDSPPAHLTIRRSEQPPAVRPKQTQPPQQLQPLGGARRRLEPAFLAAAVAVREQ